MDVGHFIRDAKPERATSEPRRVGVAVLGAGPSGLSAAWRLARLGHSDFEVYDLESNPGGTSCFGRDGVVSYPWGAHYLPVPRAEHRSLVALLSEMGMLETTAGALVAKERWRVREPEERLFIDGAWQPGLFPRSGASQRDLQDLARFRGEVDRWIRFRDDKGRRAFTLPMRRGSDAAEVTALDKLSAAAWLKQRGLASPRLRWYLEHACRDDYGMTLAQTSAWALLFYFAARTEVPGGDSAPFLTWPEGNGRVVEHLARASGPRLKLGKLVTDIVPSQDHVEIGLLDVDTRKLERVHAGHVIAALPKFTLRYLMRPWRDEAPSFLDAFSYGAWLVANLHLKHAPATAERPVAWDNVIYEGAGLGYVSATHQALRDYGPAIWTYYQPLSSDDPARDRRLLADLDHDIAATSVLTDLERAHPDLDEVVERLDVWRWGHAMVRPTPGFIWGVSRRRAAEPHGRVHFAHSDLSGLALFEEAFDRGLSAAEAVLRARGREVQGLDG